MSDIYNTPQEAIDVVLAQPEMDAVQRLAEDGSPHPDGRADTTEDGPAAVTPRHRHVSCEVYNLAGIDFARQQNARGDADIAALKTAIRLVAKKHRDAAKWVIRKRAERGQS